jgi:hypothetical protein
VGRSRRSLARLLERLHAHFHRLLRRRHCRAHRVERVLTDFGECIGLVIRGYEPLTRSLACARTVPSTKSGVGGSTSARSTPVVGSIDFDATRPLRMTPLAFEVAVSRKPWSCGSTDGVALVGSIPTLAGTNPCPHRSLPQPRTPSSRPPQRVMRRVVLARLPHVLLLAASGARPVRSQQRCRRTETARQSWLPRRERVVANRGSAE